MDNWPSDHIAWEARIFELFNHARSLSAGCLYEPSCENSILPLLILTVSLRPDSKKTHSPWWFSGKSHSAREEGTNSANLRH